MPDLTNELPPGFISLANGPVMGPMRKDRARLAPPAVVARPHRPARPPQKPKAPPAPRRAPCALQGERVADQKVSCREGYTPAFVCLSTDRPPRYSKRDGRELARHALPASSCENATGTLNQPCALCPLWTAQDALPRPPLN